MKMLKSYHYRNLPTMYLQENFEEHYRQIPEELTLKYENLNFENHCYLRIALDMAIGAKWDTRIEKPAYKNLTIKQKALVISCLRAYWYDKEMLLSHNAISMSYRGKLV